MTDFIQFNKESFMNIKSTVSVIETVKSRYDDVFNTYECFNNMIFITITKGRKDGGIFPRTNHKTSSGIFDMKRKIIIKPVRKTIQSNDNAYIKKCKSILNIINDANYQKQLSKMKFLIDKDNVDEIIMNIINTSVLQVFYSHIFVKLLKDINYSDRISQILNNFIITYLDKGFYHDHSSEMSNNAYDTFCDIQKYKTIMISTAKILFTYIHNNFCDITKKHFIERIIHNIVYDNELVIDICLNILKECKSICTSVNDIIPGNIAENISDNIMTSKVEFLLEKIYE